MTKREIDVFLRPVLLARAALPVLAAAASRGGRRQRQKRRDHLWQERQRLRQQEQALFQAEESDPE